MKTYTLFLVVLVLAFLGSCETPVEVDNQVFTDTTGNPYVSQLDWILRAGDVYDFYNEDSDCWSGVESMWYVPGGIYFCPNENDSVWATRCLEITLYRDLEYFEFIAEDLPGVVQRYTINSPEWSYQIKE